MCLLKQNSHEYNVNLMKNHLMDQDALQSQSMLPHFDYGKGGCHYGCTESIPI